MVTHKVHDLTDSIYFVTFTCYQWMPLFEITDIYSEFDKWFGYLESKKASVLGYVIMPNHFHGLIFLSEDCQATLNTLIANGKRFLAYEIIKRLKQNNASRVLRRLKYGVSEANKTKGSKHRVFIPSFDAKLCFDRKMVETKLDYIHRNPVEGKWHLVYDWVEYPYSSAGFYMSEAEVQHQYLKDYRGFI